VRHAAVAVLYRSSLRDEMDLDQVLETFEVKRQRFWEKLFKAGNNRKKKGAFIASLVGLVGLMMSWCWKACLGCLWSFSSSAMAWTRYSVHQEPHLGCRALSMM
jgi:hypothetical protein